MNSLRIPRWPSQTTDLVTPLDGTLTLFAVTPQKDGHAMTVIKWLVRAFPTWKARCVFAHIKPVPRTAASRLPTPS
jgi:hypothetical protein